MHDNPFLDPPSGFGDIPDTLTPADHSALYDVPRITTILQSAARECRAVSYSELLMALGFRFTRPKMRVVCKTLATVDAESILHGEPPLAVLVVRESDRLPGQGYWIDRQDYYGEWTGPDAQAYVNKHQSAAFTYWSNRT
jgi:hypothetical protein